MEAEVATSQFTYLSHRCHKSIQPCCKHGHRVLSGWSTTLSNSVQTASMTVSHFILGINFCTANGHSYVAKLNRAINKAEASTKSCRKWSAKSLAVASLWHQESHGKQKKDGEIPAWALHARTASRSWGKSSCDSHGAVVRVGMWQATCKACSTPCTSRPRCFLLPSPSKLCNETLLVMGFCLPYHGGLPSMLS